MEPELIPISLPESFGFACTPEVPCFNQCCRDLNQSLTPYDILRLKNHLGLSSGQFLAKYTSRHTGPESGLPVITLKTDNARDLTCPFLTPNGCRVYADRPSSCRTYPLMRAAARSRETGRITEHFMVLKEPHCRGFDAAKTRTVRQWIDEQQIAVYNQINDRLLPLISLKNRLRPGVLDLKSGQLFFTALYDLDGFKAQIVNTDLLAGFRIDPALTDKALKDDLALLELGMQWVKQVLFGGE